MENLCYTMRDTKKYIIFNLLVLLNKVLLQPLSKNA